MKQDTYYFQHDYNARGDLKIQALLHDLKGKGYGVYWVVVEMLHEEPSHVLPLKPYTYIAIAQQVNETPESVEKIITACISKYDLFFEQDGYLQCNRVNANILRRKEISNLRSSAGKQGAIAKQMLANAQQMLANAQQNQAKEIKEKEKKEKEINIPFEIFWNAYDKKEDRKKCEVKWLNLTDSERQCIMDRIPAYVQATPIVQYRKNPLTYLNGRCWEDEAHNRVTTEKINKAVSIDENDMIHYENGKVYASPSYEMAQQYRQGKVDISIFDRKVS